MVQLINAADLWTAMENEANKRRMISADQRHRIVEIYAAAENDALSRMLDYWALGYRRIRVLRPLRMPLHIHAESLARLKAEKAWAKLTAAQQAARGSGPATVSGHDPAPVVGGEFCGRHCSIHSKAADKMTHTFHTRLCRKVPPFGDRRPKSGSARWAQEVFCKG